MTFTTEQILALAPDASSAKAGQGLAATLYEWVTSERRQEPAQEQLPLAEPRQQTIEG